MARHIDFFRLTYRDQKEFCDNLTCISHDPPLQVSIERESGIKFYTMNRKQLHEFWQCYVRDQQHFCDLGCPNSCKICPWVKAVHKELRDHFFFDFDRSKEHQPVLWKVFSSLLDRKLLPCLVEIQVIERK